MTQTAQKNIYFTVGPSQVYPTVPKHIQTAIKENILSLSHRSERFSQIYKTATDNLRELLDVPASHHIFFTTSALEGMERTIQSTVGKHSFHFVNGSFSREFYQIAIDYKKNALRYDVPNGEGFTMDEVSIPAETELVCFVQNETSTGVATPMQDIYTIAKRYPDKLLALDVVSSVPYVVLDFSKIDVTIFSVQKGLGLPAGLGVLIVSDRAIKKAETLAAKGETIGSYHNFLKLKEFGDKYQTRETPNVLNIYLLSKVTEDLLKEGIQTIRIQTEQKAKLLYAHFDNHPKYTPATSKSYRSNTTIVIDVKGDSDKIVTNAKKHGFVIAKGYGKRKDQHIRIANFPAHTKEQVEQLLQIIRHE